MTAAPARTAWRTLGAAATALVLLIAGLVAWTYLSPKRTDDRHFEHRGAPARVTVRTGDGEVTVQPGPGSGVTVDSHLSWSSPGKPDASAKVVGDTLEVVGTCPGNGFKLGLGSRCTVDFVVHVPAATAVEVHTDGGAVRAADLTGAVMLSSAAGDVTADNLSGTLSLSSDAGSVSGSNLRCPDVRARVDSGDLSLSFAAVPGTVTAVADAGDIDLALARGSYQVHAQTDNGSPEVTVTDDPAAASTVNARTSAGSVHIRYAS